MKDYCFKVNAIDSYIRSQNNLNQNSNGQLAVLCENSILPWRNGCLRVKKSFRCLEKRAYGVGAIM